MNQVPYPLEVPEV